MPKCTAVTCETCGIQIGRKVDLKRHMKLHAENKEAMKYPCPFFGCQYKTLQKSNLKNHINTHTGQRPYKCPTEGCEFDTSDRGLLTRHRKITHGYVPRRRARTRAVGASEVQPSMSSLTPGDSTLPVEAIPEAYQTPLPEPRQILEPGPFLISPMDHSINNGGSKSGPSPFGTDSVTKYSWDNNAQIFGVAVEGSSLSSSLLAPGLLSKHAPMSGYSQVSATVRNAPLPTLPLPTNTVDNDFLSFSIGLYANDPTYLASLSSLASTSHLATSTFSGYPNNARTSNAQPIGDYRYARPEMGMHLQRRGDVDQMHASTTSTWSSGYPIQGSVYPSDPYHCFLPFDWH